MVHRCSPELLKLANGTESNVWKPPTLIEQARAALTKFLKGNCSIQAKCLPVYTEEVFTCACREGYKDVSPDPVNKPGQVCVKGHHLLHSEQMDSALRSEVHCR